ncbi:MAG: cytochrome P450, partial [Longimicrobiales bacterium]
MTALLIAEAGILGVALAQVVRFALKPPVWREIREAPIAASLLIILGVIATYAAARAAIAWDAARHGCAAALAGGMLFTAWRARPSYGSRRRFPPGSLGIGSSIDAIRDRGSYRDQAARHGPLFKTSQFGRPVICILGLARIRDVFREHGESLEGATLPYNKFVPHHMLRYMAEDSHRRLAPVFRSAFASMDLAFAEDSIRSTCSAELDRLARDSTQNSKTGTNARPYFTRWLVSPICRVFFGLEPDDPRVGRIASFLPYVVIDRTGGPIWARRLEKGLDGMADVVRDIARERSSNAGAGTNRTALDALLATDPDALENDTVARNLVMTVRTSSSDVAGLADWLFKFLGDHPEWRQQVRAAGRTAGAPTASMDPASRFVLETLRMEQSEYLYRKVTRTFEYGGYVIPAGWLLRMLIQESHRDPAVFAEPDRFDPDRWIGRAHGRSDYSPFGADAHGCMGPRLTHFLARIFVEEVSIGYDWHVVSDGPVVRGNRHRHHWRPSPHLRVV